MKKITAFLLVMLLGSCATLNMEPDRVYLWANDVYKYHYFLYVEQVASPAYTREELQEFRENPEKIKAMQINPDISDDKWKVLEQKKEILKEMESALEAVRIARGAGNKPPSEQIDTLANLGDKLITLFGE